MCERIAEQPCTINTSILKMAIANLIQLATSSDALDNSAPASTQVRSSAYLSCTRFLRDSMDHIGWEMSSVHSEKNEDGSRMHEADGREL